MNAGGHGENRTRDKGFADPCLATWPRGPVNGVSSVGGVRSRRELRAEAATEELRHLISGICSEPVVRMDVGVGSNPHVGVAEHLLNRADVDAQGEQQRGTSVTQVVHAVQRIAACVWESVAPPSWR